MTYVKIAIQKSETENNSPCDLDVKIENNFDSSRKVTKSPVHIITNTL